MRNVRCSEASATELNMLLKVQATLLSSSPRRVTSSLGNMLHGKFARFSNMIQHQPLGKRVVATFDGIEDRLVLSLCEMQLLGRIGVT